MDRLSQNGKILAIIQFLRLIFGVYLVITDFTRYSDPGSALTVFVIYLVLGIFTYLFIKGRKAGLPGILVLSLLLIIFNSIFTILAANGTINGGMHDPLNNLWSTLLRYVFFLATFYYGVKVIQENRR